MNCGKNPELTMLNQIRQAVRQEKNLSLLLRHVLRILCGKNGLQSSSVAMLRNNRLCIVSSHGFSREQKRRTHFRLGEGIQGEVALSGRPRIIPDVSKEPAFFDCNDAHNNESHKAFLCVPILHWDKVIGTLSICRESGTQEELARDCNLLELVADLTAEAISREVPECENFSLSGGESRKRQEPPSHTPGFSGIIGECQAMRQVYTMIRQVASSSATVLIRGASGTGKELLARALQRAGDRRDRPFVVVNSAALPENLIESELFGHEKGAFTGAVNRRIGRVETASSGTLFLDEIGDVGPQVQIKLLRFLQERTFQRVGGNKELSADVRIIAATSRNLEQLMEKGLFREDLYYRLNVFPIMLPNLAERRTDIPLLAEHFREKFSQLHRRKVRRISATAMNLMVEYAWPGNVRELENCMERAVLSTTDDTIHAFCLPAALQCVQSSEPRVPVFGDFMARVEAFEHEMLDEALKAHRGNVAATARSLNLTVRVIHYKIRKLGLNPAAYRRTGEQLQNSDPTEFRSCF